MKGTRAIDQSARPARPRPPRARILVVTGDADEREELRTHLRAAGYEAIAAEDAIAAGHRVLADPPDLILAEANLPWLSGVEFAAALQADRTLPWMPVILMCDAAEAAALANKSIGCTLLTRPLLPDRLLEAVRRELELARVPVR